MRTTRTEVNPYSVLGVPKEATHEQVVEAYRARKVEASRSDPSMVIHIEAAFQVLKEPESREQIDRKLQDQALGVLSAEVSRQAHVRRKESRARWGKGATLGVLLVVLSVSLFLALNEKDAVCPWCEHFSVTGEKLSDGRVAFSCSRQDCEFSYTYELEADAEAEHEAEEMEQAGLTE